jgi:hypothetical protein
VPYHTGSNPIIRGYLSHIDLLYALVDQVIENHAKILFYRTWSFDGFIFDPAYYLNVTNVIEPGPNLLFVIKNTQYDFWRITLFNPTIDQGIHPYLVEVQCQREYESKGAVPKYVMNGVIEGFKENKNDLVPYSLSEIRDNELFRGLVVWTRGGGWMGPYPADEFGIDMNVRNLVAWAQDTDSTEEEIFSGYTALLSDLLNNADEIQTFSQTLREIALLSA